MNQARTVASEASMLNSLKKTRGWPCDTSNQWMQLLCTELPIFKLLWGKDKNLQLSFADMNEDELDHSHKSEVDLVWRNKYEPLSDMVNATMCALVVEVILVTNH